MTTVIFLRDQENERDGIFAYFPQLNHNMRLYGNTQKQCYSTIGQHSVCHVDYADKCERATKKEYLPLLHELEGIGYELKILNK